MAKHDAKNTSSKARGIDRMIDEATGKEYEEITIDYYKPKVIKEAYGVNGPVIQYYMPLEEVHNKYGKPGDLNGYESPILYGSRIQFES